MPGPAPVTVEYVAIVGANGDTIPIPCVAWHVDSLLPLWQGPDTVGDNRRLPGAAGRRALPKYAEESKRTLNMAFFGEVLHDGTAPSSPRAGLEANLFYFRDNIADPDNGSGPVTKAATLHLPSGATRTAAIQVADFQFSDLGGASCLATLDLIIPAGAFA